MHLHVPKPIHGWKQFFNEVAVITVGIGIALGGEELVTHWNEERYAKKSLAAIKDELAVNLGRMQSRLKTADCVDKRLNEVAAYIETTKPQKRPTWVGRPQIWAMQTGALDAAKSYGSMTILPSDEQMAISSVYATMANYAGVQKDEQWAWSELRSLSEDRDLTDSDRASLRQAIQRARYAAWQIRLDAMQALEQAETLDIKPSDDFPGSQSVCIPMDTPFDEAVAKSGKRGYPEPH